MVEKKKRKRDAKELESNVGPTVDVSEVNVKKKKKMRTNTGPTCVNDAESGKKDKKKKKRNVVDDDDLDVAIADKKKNEKEKKKKRRRRNGGPTGDDEAGGGDDYDEPTGDDEGGAGDDYDEPTGDDEAGDDEENRREMLNKKKKKKKRRVKEIVEAIKAVVKTASEAALSVYIASHQKKKSKLAQLQHDYSDRGREEAIKAVEKAASEAALSVYIASHQKKKKKKSKLAQLQHDYSDRGREEEDPSMDLGHKVLMRNADDTTLVTANNQSLPLYERISRRTIARLALAEYNFTARLNREEEFELASKRVKLNCFYNSSKDIYWYHLNFRVMSSQKKYVMFAEVSRVGGEFRVLKCETVTAKRHQVAFRLYGCEGCDKTLYRGMIIHPLTGFYKRRFLFLDQAT